MRRLFSFLIDFAIAGSLAFSLILLTETLTDRSLYSLPIFLVITGLLIATFESMHAGVTPGRLTTGLVLISLSDHQPTSFRLFSRACLLLLFPFCISIACEFIFEFLFQKEQIIKNLATPYGFAANLLLFGSTYVFSHETQSLHDFFCRTAIVRSQGSTSPRPLSSRFIWFSGILATMLVTLLYFSFSLGNKQLRNAANNALPVRMANAMLNNARTDPKLLDLLVPKAEIEDRVFDVDRNYEGSLQPIGISSLNDIRNAFHLTDEPLLTNVYGHAPYETAVRMSAILTAQGMRDIYFQEQFARAVCSIIYTRTGIGVCILSYAYFQHLIGPAFISITRRTIAVGVNLNPLTLRPEFVTLSPKDGLQSAFTVMNNSSTLVLGVEVKKVENRIFDELMQQIEETKPSINLAK